VASRSEFEKMAMPHLRAAYQLAFALLRSKADAEDAVNDSYVRAFRAIGQLQGASIKPWLLTIVRNVCYRYMQQRQRTRNVISLDEALASRGGDEDGEWQIPSDEPSPEQAALNASNEALLGRLLSGLAPVFREVIVLREIEGLSYREIADITGTPQGTVMSRLSRARSELLKLAQHHQRTESKNAL
jgi:RNA polymerase sigma-70 factor, ECF subfamily